MTFLVILHFPFLLMYFFFTKDYLLKFIEILKLNFKFPATI